MSKRASRGSASRAQLASAKERLLDECGERPWLMALGIAEVDGKLGLVVSVKPSAKPAAARVVNRLRLGVPVAIRGVEEVRARPSPDGKKGASEKRVAELRRLARRRLG